MLSDNEIDKLVRSKQLGIEPYDRTLLQPASYDLTLADRLLIPSVGNPLTTNRMEGASRVWVDPRGEIVPSSNFPMFAQNPWSPAILSERWVPKRPDTQYTSMTTPVSDKEGPTMDWIHGYWLAPGQFVLGSSLERVKLPDFMVARIEGKSTLARWGLMVHVTAGFVDPGFEGNLTLELYNVGPFEILLTPAMAISQLSFDVMRNRATKPYRGKYQGSEGAVEPRRKIEALDGLNINIGKRDDGGDLLTVGPGMDVDPGSATADSPDHSH